MTITRRDVLASGAALGSATLLARPAAARSAPAPAAQPPTAAAPARPPAIAGHVIPSPPGRVGSVITPGGTSMPWTERDGVKVFHLVAEPVRHEFAPGLTAECWGYNGLTPGPTIEVVEGDRCRFYVSNQLPEATTVHWHGVLVPNGMDGAAGLTQKAILPGETYRYEFRFDKAGTFMYHPHADEMTQIALGMTGMIVVHPRRPHDRGPVRDHALLLQSWSIPAGTRRPNPIAMSDFNVLTINGKAFPATTPLWAELGDTVRIRFGNLSPMEHHPLHLHGHAFRVVATDGGDIPREAQWPETTVLVPAGSVRTIEFTADNPGDWPLHCHMTHHAMNQMGHAAANMTGAELTEVDREMRKVIPGYMSMGQTGMGLMAEMGMPAPENSIPMMGGPGPFGTIDMGGMFTVLKVRPRAKNGDPGWYRHPEGSVARPATAAELRADGVHVR